MDEKTYRRCVRVLILKEDKVLLGRMRKEGQFICYLFPGGGVEEGDSIEESARKECLEEVGIAVKNVRQMGYVVKYTCEFDKPERAALYLGCEDFYCLCDYGEDDKKLYGSEGDSLLCTWETPEVAIALIEREPQSPSNDSKVEVLRKLIAQREIVAAEAACQRGLAVISPKFHPW